MSEVSALTRDSAGKNVRSVIARAHRWRPFRSASVDGGFGERIERLENRLGHLEAALEGLQDAVHRESVRRNEELAGLKRRTEPRELTRALSDDARRRGI
jgi:uncharacterized coiled-coil protein SlyX